MSIEVVYLPNNFYTSPKQISGYAADIITKFPGHHPMIEKADKFETSHCEVRGW